MVGRSGSGDRATGDLGWAFNLALFRIVFLAVGVLPFCYANVRWTRQVMAALPLDAWHPISFYRYIPFDILTNSMLAQGLAVTNLAAVGLGIIGLHTRAALSVGTLLSLYVLGLTQNQGKVDHFHHIVWFMALLAAGPSGEVLSVDAARAARRRADRGLLEPRVTPGAALWTLRYVWALVALLYFVPGVAKLEAALTQGWASADNLRRLIWQKSLENALYTPGFVYPSFVDALPSWLFPLIGWSAIAFELGAILLVWCRPVRWLVPIAGLGFHVGNAALLNIHAPFASLMAAYVAFFDWSALAHRLGPLRILYDGGCELCRRTIALLRTWDIGRALEPVPGLGGDPRRREHPEITDAMLTHDLYAVGRGRPRGGYDAYQAIAWRLPLLWPAALVIAFPLVAMIGRRVYRRVADSRTCGIGPRPAPTRLGRARRAWVVHVVGIALVVLQATVSAAELSLTMSARRPLPSPALRSLLAAYGWRAWWWPFDQYPPFNQIWPESVEMWEARMVLADGREARFGPAVYSELLGTPTRCLVVTSDILREPDERRRKERSLSLVRALWGRQPGREVQETRVYRARYKPGPPPLAPPTDERLLYTFPIAEIRGQAV